MMEPGIPANKTTEGSFHFCRVSANTSCIAVITPSLTRALVYLLMGSTFSILIIAGNLLVIISVIYFRQLHTPTNFLIGSLAVADLLVGALVLLFNMALSLQTCVHFGDVVCRMRRSLDISLMMASILNLCCISIDRYHAICQPLVYRSKMNNTVVTVMIIASWTISPLFGFSAMFLVLRSVDCDGRCFIFHMPASNAVGTIIFFYIPVLVMLSIYLRIFLVARKQARCIRSTKEGAVVSKMERKATKTLAIVMGAFLLCWTPFFISLTVNPLIKYSIPLPLTETLVWLGWSNSMLNPFVYAFLYSWFRSAFRLIVSGKIVTGHFKNAKLM